VHFFQCTFNYCTSGKSRSYFKEPAPRGENQ